MKRILSYGTSARVGILTLIILVCWSPWVVLAFPGDVHFDTVNQIYQFYQPAPTYYYEMDVMVDAEFLDHHPVFDTLLFGSFIRLGDVFGSQNAGVFIYVLLQLVASASILAFSIEYLKKLNVSRIVRLGALGFVALFPPFAQFAATMSKDSLFVLVYLIFFLCMIELYLTKGARFKDTRFLAVLVVAIVLCLLTKKTGVFIIGITGAAMLLAHKSWRRRILATFFIPIFICTIMIPAVVYPLLGVAPGGKQESLSPLFQQTATFFLEYPDEVSFEEYELVSNVLDPDRFQKLYRAESADPIKATFKEKASAADVINYLGVWVLQGLRHPEAYLGASLKVSAGFVLPIKKIEHYGYTFKEDHADLFEEKYGGTTLSVHKPEELRAISEKVQLFYYDTIEGSPVLLFLFSNALWAFWVPMFCMILSVAKRKDSIIVFIPMGVVILFLLITPLVLSRYLLPSLYSIPLLIGLLIYSFKTSKNI